MHTPDEALTLRDPQALLAQTLRDWPAGGDLWVFGYASLIWRPEFDADETRGAAVHGWHRALRMRSRVNRGTPQQPGLVFALLPGGACRGVVYRLDPKRADEELDKLWAIGKAKASPAGTGGADPADDRSPGADGMLAGLVIGGLDTDDSHEAVCITSPPIDTSKLAGTLWVSFWRHLHAPALPGVIHTVDVWNGAAWKTLETGYGATTDDPAWAFVKFNATGSQAKDFRVRVCVERMVGAPDFAGWSIDDLSIGPPACAP